MSYSAAGSYPITNSPGFESTIRSYYDIIRSNQAFFNTEFETSAGSMSDLHTRLAVSINNDGTLKGSGAVGAEWTSETTLPTKTSDVSFTFSGTDKTDIFTVGRAVKMNGNLYGHVLSVSFSTDTLVTLQSTSDTVPATFTLLDYGIDPLSQQKEVDAYFDTINIGIAGLHILDNNGTHDMIFTVGSDFTADRTLTISTGDNDREIILNGSPTLSDWFDQSVKSSATPTFSKINVGIAGLHILDNNGTHDMIFTVGSDFTADRTLTISTGDSDREIILNGSPTLNDWFDQSVKSSATPTFSKIIGGSGSGGTLTLESTSHATKGQVLFGVSGNSIYDEANDRLGIGVTPLSKVHIKEGDAHFNAQGVSNELFLGSNNYWSGTQWNRPNTSGASYQWYHQSGNVMLRVAPSGANPISWTEVLIFGVDGTTNLQDKSLKRSKLIDTSEITYETGTGGSTTFDFENGNVQSRTINATATLGFTNPITSGDNSSMVLFLTNAGSETITWTNVDWAGGVAPTLTASGVDILGFTTNDGGTTYHGVAISIDSK